MLRPARGPATIAILGGDPVTGKALESLLASAEHAARYFLPASSGRRQKALKAQIKNTPSTMNLPVIELTTTPIDDGQSILVPWPCSIEDLRRSIDRTLLDS
jgi:N-acetyl-gamma-glutamylphosphate reductase